MREKIRKFLKEISAWLLLIMTGRGPLADEAERAGICDFSGQGRGED